VIYTALQKQIMTARKLAHPVLMCDSVICARAQLLNDENRIYNVNKDATDVASIPWCLQVNQFRVQSN